jgi:hypothetical protein
MMDDLDLVDSAFVVTCCHGQGSWTTAKTYTAAAIWK